MNLEQMISYLEDILGVSEPEITIEGDNHIRVKLAGVTNKEEAREVLSSTASLTFRDTTNHLLMTSDVLGGNAKISADEYGNPAVSLSIKDKDTFYDVTSKVSKIALQHTIWFLTPGSHSSINSFALISMYSHCAL